MKRHWIVAALAALAAGLALAPAPAWGWRARSPPDEHLDEATAHAGSSWRHGKASLWHAGAAGGEAAEAAEEAAEGLGSRPLHPSRLFKRSSVSAAPQVLRAGARQQSWAGAPGCVDRWGGGQLAAAARPHTVTERFRANPTHPHALQHHGNDYDEVHTVEAPLERVEHPRFYDLRGRLSKSYGEGVPELQRAAGHAQAADRDIARFLREHGLDAGADRAGLEYEEGGGPSVLGCMREGLDRTAQLLGLKTEQPYYAPGLAGSGGGGGEAGAEGLSLADRLSAAWRSMPASSRLFTSEHAAAEEEARHESGGERYAVGGKEYTYGELASELAKVRL
jgi:hypothetical protein